MNELPPLDAARIEQLKKDFVIDETVAKKYDRPIPVIEKGLDPRLVALIMRYLRRSE